MSGSFSIFGRVSILALVIILLQSHLAVAVTNRTAVAVTGVAGTAPVKAKPLAARVVWKSLKMNGAGAGML